VQHNQTTQKENLTIEVDAVAQQQETHLEEERLNVSMQMEESERRRAQLIARGIDLI
jgi:hypothetical protein